MPQRSLQSICSGSEFWMLAYTANLQKMVSLNRDFFMGCQMKEWSATNNLAYHCSHWLQVIIEAPGPFSVWHWCLPGIRHNGVHQFLHRNSLRTDAPRDRLHWGSRKIEFGICGVPSCRWHRVHTTHWPLVLRTWMIEPFSATVI